MKYYGVCYGPICRWAKAASPTAAAFNSFGKLDPERMTVKEAPKNPHEMTRKAKLKFMHELFHEHKEKTGEDGYMLQ